MQTPFDRGKWPVAGSTSYYALLHCGDAAVGNASATLELIDTIADALASVSEPTVAEQKVHWWHEELARLAKGEARHPRSQTLQAQVATSAGNNKAIKSWIPDLLTVLSCNANERFSNAATTSVFMQRIADDYFARLRLLARALGATETAQEFSVSSSKEWPHDLITTDLVTGLGLSDRLRRFHKLQAGGAMVWPDSWYTEHDLQPENLYDEAKKDQLLNLFRTAASTASEALDMGLVNVWQQPQAQTDPNKLTDAETVIIAAATLRQAQLLMWQRRRTDLLRQYQSLTPFRKSLLTWRTQRKLTQLQKRLLKHGP